MLTATVAGFATGLGLIIAIGAQNAFVLRQGLSRQHVTAVVAICALSDLVLISAGVSGVGVIVERADWALVAVRWLGVAFLTGYGVLSLRRAVRPGSLHAARTGAAGIGAAVATALALTWLNPHLYLDILLLGSIANAQGDGRWWFAVGAGLGSIVWFTALGYGARAAHGLLSGPRAWRVLDTLIGVTMLALALGLAVSVE